MCRLALVNTLPPNPIKLLPVEGVAASIANVSNGTLFPFRPSTRHEQTTDWVDKGLIDFARSKGARHCSEQYFVPASQ